jgi:hypothetical protein
MQRAGQIGSATRSKRVGVSCDRGSGVRLRRGSTTLLTFGLWCALYGARLLALQPSMRAAIRGAPHQWAQFVALVSYASSLAS